MGGWQTGFDILIWDDMPDPIAVKWIDTWDGVKEVDDGG
jgi:hypothetical protein